MNLIVVVASCVVICMVCCTTDVDASPIGESISADRDSVSPDNEENKNVIDLAQVSDDSVKGYPLAAVENDEGGIKTLGGDENHDNTLDDDNNGDDNVSTTDEKDDAITSSDQNNADDTTSDDNVSTSDDKDDTTTSSDENNDDDTTSDDNVSTSDDKDDTTTSSDQNNADDTTSDDNVSTSDEKDDTTTSSDENNTDDTTSDDNVSTSDDKNNTTTSSDENNDDDTTSDDNVSTSDDKDDTTTSSDDNNDDDMTSDDNVSTSDDKDDTTTSSDEDNDNDTTSDATDDTSSLDDDSNRYSTDIDNDVSLDNDNDALDTLNDDNSKDDSVDDDDNDDAATSNDDGNGNDDFTDVEKDDDNSTSLSVNDSDDKTSSDDATDAAIADDNDQQNFVVHSNVISFEGPPDLYSDDHGDDDDDGDDGVDDSSAVGSMEQTELQEAVSPSAVNVPSGILNSNSNTVKDVVASTQGKSTQSLQSPKTSLAEQSQAHTPITTDNGLIVSLFDETSMLDLLHGQKASNADSAKSTSNALSSMQTNFFLPDEASVSSFLNARHSTSSDSGSAKSQQEKSSSTNILASALGVLQNAYGTAAFPGSSGSDGGGDDSHSDSGDDSRSDSGDDSRSDSGDDSEGDDESDEVDERGGREEDGEEGDGVSLDAKSDIGSMTESQSPTTNNNNILESDMLSEFFDSFSPSEIHELLRENDLTNFFVANNIPGVPVHEFGPPSSPPTSQTKEWINEHQLLNSPGIPVQAFGSLSSSADTPQPVTDHNEDAIFEIREMFRDLGIPVSEQDIVSLLTDESKFDNFIGAFHSSPVSSTPNTQSNTRSTPLFQPNGIPSVDRISSSSILSSPPSIQTFSTGGPSVPPLSGTSSQPQVRSPHPAESARRQSLVTVSNNLFEGRSDHSESPLRLSEILFPGQLLGSSGSSTKNLVPVQGGNDIPTDLGVNVDHLMSLFENDNVFNSDFGEIRERQPSMKVTNGGGSLQTLFARDIGGEDGMDNDFLVNSLLESNGMVDLLSHIFGEETEDVGHISTFGAKASSRDGGSDSDSNESDSNESNSNESDSNESDSNESDSNESDSNESDSNESDSNESDSNESDSNESDSNESDSNESDSNESDSNESDSNESDSNESDSNESDSNESNSNESDSNESDSNESDSSENSSEHGSSEENNSSESESNEGSSEDTNLFEQIKTNFDMDDFTADDLDYLTDEEIDELLQLIDY